MDMLTNGATQDVPRQWLGYIGSAGRFILLFRLL